jgi:hypothetical protein
MAHGVGVTDDVLAEQLDCEGRRDTRVEARRIHPAAA